MTIGSQYPYVTSIGDGIATVWPFNFLVRTLTDLEVGITDSAGVYTPTANFTTTGLGVETGGTITYPSSGTPLPVGSKITIRRIALYDQTSRIDPQGFSPEIIETGMDRLAEQVQQLHVETERAVKQPVSENANTVLPVVAERKNKFLAFDTNGSVTALANGPSYSVSTEGVAFSTKAAAEGASIVGAGTAVLGFRVLGYYTIFDGGDFDVVWRASEPALGLKLQTADGAWWEVVNAVVRPEMAGAKGDGVTDDSAAFQIVENFADANGLVVKLRAKTYAIGAQITWGFKSTWQGSGRGEIANSGTKLLCIADGITIIRADGGGVATYLMGQLKDFSIENDFALYPTSTGIWTGGGSRQLYLSRLRIRGFLYGHRHSAGGGELYVNDVFISQCVYNIFWDTVADSKIIRTHAGSGVSFSGATGGGMIIKNANNIQITDSRPQVSKAAAGLSLDNATFVVITNNWIDQNEGDGVVITGNSGDIILTGGFIYDCGTTSNKKAAVAITANAGDAIGPIIISSLIIKDKNKGTGSEVMDKGIVITTTATGTIDEVTVSDVNFEGVNNPLKVNVTTPIKIACHNCRGLVGGVSNRTELVGTSGYVPVATDGNCWVMSGLTANRSINFQASGKSPPLNDLAPGALLRVELGDTPSGNYRLSVSVDGVEVSALSLGGEYCLLKVSDDGKDISVVQHSTKHRATNTQMATSTQWINALSGLKSLNNEVLNSSTGIWYRPVGNASTDNYTRIDDQSTVLTVT